MSLRIIYTIVWCCHDYEQQGNLAREKKVELEGMLARDLEGMSFRIAFITIAFFDTSLSMILLKQEWLNMACPQNFRFFFSKIRQCVRFVRTLERVGVREKKKGTMFFFIFPTPTPTPFNLRTINPSRFLFPYARATISKEKIEVLWTDYNEGQKCWDTSVKWPLFA